MMRIGCCSNMIAPAPGDTGIAFVEKLARFGFDYVELPLAETSALPEKEFLLVLERLDKSGLACEACNNFFPKTMRLTGSNVDNAAVARYADKALSRAALLGAECVVFGSGPAKNIPDGFPPDEGYRQIVTLLRETAPVAEARGITIVIEPLRRAECNVINTFAEGCALVEDVNKDNVKALVDYYHMTEENESPLVLLDKGKALLRHAHFARSAGRAYPDSADEDGGYAAFFNALKTIGYDRRISLEAYTSDFDAQAPAALLFLRQMVAAR